MPIRSVSLDDKYDLESGTAYMSGIHALVRLPIEQMRRDRRAGLNTGCLISGYEGSPLGGYDIALERAGGFLDRHGIRFVPGVNEELALAAVMGSQLFQAFPKTPLRWCRRHLVRQGARLGPERRCAAPRQLRRDRGELRGAGVGRR